jgi:anti-anti-sigma factor
MTDNNGFKILMTREGLPTDTARLIFRGRFILPLTQRFAGEVERLMSAGIMNLKVELSELTYMDSTGISAFIAVHKKLRDSGGALELENPRKLIRHIFISSKLDRELTLLET